jgi:membrane protease YdiL (CAAX protease family)
MHFDSLTAVPPLIIFGIVLGWWKEKTGWILFPIIAHLTNNILVVFVQ